MREEGAPPGEWLRSNVLTVAIAGVLLAGGGVGLAFNNTSAASENAVAMVPGDPVSDISAPVTLVGETLPAATLVRTVAARPVSFEALTPPQNPFVRTAADPLPAAAVAAPTLGSESSTAGPVRASQAAAVAKPAEAAPAVDMDALAITGLVQGDPPLVVVRYEGQSLFLKIGDQIADTWRLVEIKERSAIFQLGARRVEVPIKGGSSE